jgi:hypothetical protein
MYNLVPVCYILERMKQFIIQYYIQEIHRHCEKLGNTTYVRSTEIGSSGNGGNHVQVSEPSEPLGACHESTYMVGCNTEICRPSWRQCTGRRSNHVTPRDLVLFDRSIRLGASVVGPIDCAPMRLIILRCRTAHELM